MNPRGLAHALLLAVAGALLPAQAAGGAALALPVPGQYGLPAIQRAGNGWVLDGNLLPRRLSGYTQGAITLLSFIYTYCTDPTGCPLAYATMQGVKKRIGGDASLHGQVRFVSLSFDPTNDTPQAMQRYAAAQQVEPFLQCSFLTTYSTRFLRPILASFGQDVELQRDTEGQPTRVISHMLKVFLIDRAGRVREVYSTAYMDPQLIFNDVKTLALEAARR